MQTTDDVLKSQEEASRFISQFLDIVGLLALLVSGIGIANTMQVLLSRRRIEIAMLKTSGYRRRDPYLLFGLEAAWLGLAGGAVGALLGAGVSFAVTRLVENVVGQHLEPQLDPLTVLSSLDPPHKAAAARRLSDADPQAGVIDLADFGAIVDQILRNLLILLTSLASLALLAGGSSSPTRWRWPGSSAVGRSAS